MPWISQGEYRRLLRQLAHAEERALNAEERLESERAANRRSERHWSNMLLRARQSYPEQPPEPTAPVAAEVLPSYDPGELAAQLEAARSMGIPEAEARKMFFQWKGVADPEAV
jgi:hypothetical protein